MAHFTYEQKQKIERMLLQKGKELFEENGLKAVTVDILVKEIGIGKGTFYHFYRNKEHLFYTISNLIQKQVYKEIAEEKMDAKVYIPKDFVEEVLNLLLDKFMEHPILSQIKQADYAIMANKIPIDYLQESTSIDRDILHFLKSKGIQFAYDENDMVSILQLIFSQLSVIEQVGYDVKLVRIQLKAITREMVLGDK